LSLSTFKSEHTRNQKPGRLNLKKSCDQVDWRQKRNSLLECFPCIDTRALKPCHIVFDWGMDESHSPYLGDVGELDVNLASLCLIASRGPTFIGSIRLIRRHQGPRFGGFAGSMSPIWVPALSPSQIPRRCDSFICLIAIGAIGPLR
jgi:hypothetical protein